MQVFMLGWEFPPFITGGLGTACYGLTRALDRRGVGVLFALPKAVAGESSSHVRILAPDQAVADIRPGGVAPAIEEAAGASTSPPGAPSASSTPAPSGTSQGAHPLAERDETFEHVSFLTVPIVVSSGYARPSASPAIRRERETGEATPEGAVDTSGVSADILGGSIINEVLPEAGGRTAAEEAAAIAAGPDYTGDMITQVRRYADFCMKAARRVNFDVVHAHDWITYPAGLAVSRVSGKPLVVHVHSTEFDRSGVHVNQQIYDIERRGMHGAMKVITVSQLTKNIVVSRYAVHPDKVEVVYNGVDLEPTQSDQVGIRSRDKIVLYFGRITMQKGPEYFIAAAKRVLEHMDNVKFVVAGSGDMATRMIEMAAALGIGHKVLFTGFLRGRDIQRVFSMADLYVMPSVSEPFGIAPLEAMSHDVPVIISKSSGVSEILVHALKVDFWDIDDMANKIIAVLKRPPLSRTLRQHGAFEVRRLTWDGAAHRCEQVYSQVAAGVPTFG